MDERFAVRVFVVRGEDFGVPVNRLRERFGPNEGRVADLIGMRPRLLLRAILGDDVRERRLPKVDRRESRLLLTRVLERRGALRLVDE